MLDKQVCPNCGQLYDTGLTNCPLCGAAAQVVEVDSPVQRKRITEAERKKRRADRKEAEQEARRRRKDEQMLQDAEEERLLEEASQRRKEERRKKKEAKKAAKEAKKGTKAPEDETVSQPGEAPAPVPTPVVTPGPARTKQRPVVQELRMKQDRTRTPRVFLILSMILLVATLAVGGSYLLWKLEVVRIPWYDQLLEYRLRRQHRGPRDRALPSGRQLHLPDPERVRDHAHGRRRPDAAHRLRGTRRHHRRADLPDLGRQRGQGQPRRHRDGGLPRHRGHHRHLRLESRPVHGHLRL